MPLKKKIAWIIILAFILNLLLIALYLKIFIARDISIGIDHLSNQFAAFMQDLGPDTTLRELSIIIDGNLKDSTFLNTVFLKLISDNIRYSLMLLPVLLAVVLFFINKEVCKPLNKLIEAINAFNHKNGYYTTQESRNEIAKLSNNFFLMSEQIEKSKRQQNEFISCISHDLKTPLTSILGYTQRLIHPGISDEQKRIKYYQTILSKANTIQTMVEELNTYIMGEIQEVSLKKVSIKHFLYEIVEEYHEELLTYSINLTPHIDLSDEIQVLLDSNQMRRVFANIFSNAVIHGSKNIEINLTASIQKDQLVVKIENNSFVPATLDYDKVFDLMYQADNSRTSQHHEGGGLGLAIVKQIIQKHDGTIKAYRPVTGGFGIVFFIPLV